MNFEELLNILIVAFLAADLYGIIKINLGRCKND